MKHLRSFLLNCSPHTAPFTPMSEGKLKEQQNKYYLVDCVQFKTGRTCFPSYETGYRGQLLDSLKDLHSLVAHSIVSAHWRTAKASLFELSVHDVAVPQRCAAIANPCCFFRRVLRLTFWAVFRAIGSVWQPRLLRSNGAHDLCTKIATPDRAFIELSNFSVFIGLCSDSYWLLQVTVV